MNYIIILVIRCKEGWKSVVNST